LGLSRSLRWAIGLASIFMVLIVYSSRGWGNLNEVLRIPIIDYILVFTFGGLLLLGQKLFGRRIP